MSYYGLLFLEKKDTISTSYLSFQRLRAQFLVYLKQSGAAGSIFVTKLVQVLSEMELYVRQKNIMMIAYQDNIRTR